MTTFLKSQQHVHLIPADDSLRKMKILQEEHLQTYQDLMVEARVRPSLLMPLIQLVFGTLGVASGLLGRTITAKAVYVIEKTIEEHHDECLRILNENNIDEKDLRKVLCNVRDSGYEIKEDVKLGYDFHLNPLEQNIFAVPEFIVKTLIDFSKKV